MNIVLDGPSGVGKTYLGKLLSEKLDLPFLDFTLDKPEYDPEDPDIEVILYNQIINNHYFSGYILENSILQAYKIKHYLYHTDQIPTPVFLKIAKLYHQHRHKVSPYILINVYDNLTETKIKRTIRNRIWEYTPETNQEDLDQLYEVTTSNYYQSRNGFSKSIISKSSSILAIINHDRSKYNNIKDEVQSLILNIKRALGSI